MTFQVNGSNGKYDGKITDESVKYGRNAVDNNIKQMQAPLVNDNFATPPVFEWIKSHAIGKYFSSDHEKRWLRKGNGLFCKSFIIALVCCTFLARLTGMNTYLLEYTRQELPQYIFKEVIRQDGVEEPVILNYGCLDLGLYTVTGTLPGCKYFCDYNINYSEIYDTQEAFILGGQADYIVLRNSLEVGEELYEEAAQCYFEMEFNDYYQTYYLYRRRDI